NIYIRCSTKQFNEKNGTAVSSERITGPGDQNLLAREIESARLPMPEVPSSLRRPPDKRTLR
ncbi:MAG TPA: hypothetical protein VM512_07485, partial [Burkholderiaceae bacterium]|nr:hypothetical protein [Burkholderiaceae bacterium]